MGSIADVDANKEGRPTLDIAGIRELTTIDIPATRDDFDQGTSSFAGRFVIAANNDVALDGVREVGQHRSRDILEG